MTGNEGESSERAKTRLNDVVASTGRDDAPTGSARRSEMVLTGDALRRLAAAGAAALGKQRIDGIYGRAFQRAKQRTVSAKSCRIDSLAVTSALLDLARRNAIEQSIEGGESEARRSLFDEALSRLPMEEVLFHRRLLSVAMSRNLSIGKYVALLNACSEIAGEICGMSDDELYARLPSEEPLVEELIV